MTPSALIDYYNRGAVTAIEVATRLLEELDTCSCEDVLPSVPSRVLSILKKLVEQYPLDDDASLVLISNQMHSDAELARRRSRARENVPAMRTWFASHWNAG